MADELRKLINLRKPIKAQVTRLKSYFEALDATAPVGPLQERFKLVEPIYQEYDKIQTQIEELVDGDAVKEREQADNRTAFEAMFFELISEIRSHINTRTQQSQLQQTPLSQTNSNSIQSINLHASNENKIPIKLPVISLPTFDGSHGKWLKFRDTFESLIHLRTDLSNIQRFHYLSSALNGDAARVIQSLGVSDSNYEIAWNILKERYENPQELVYYHAKALLNLTVITKQSSSHLRSLIDEANNHLMALKKLGEPTDSWDTLVILILTSKLDSGTRNQWKKRRLAIEGTPKLKQMIEVLERHCKLIDSEIVESSFSSNKSTEKFIKRSDQRKTSDRSASYITVNATICSLCKGSHPLYSCEDFKNLPTSARIKEVQRLQLCFNCLRPGHGNKTCTLGHCKKCSKKHNTLLHLESSKIETSNETPLPSTSQSITMVTRSTGESPGLLATALVYVEDSQGKKHECRALLDPGSQSHLITQNLSQKLKLPRTQTNIVISGIEQGGRHVSFQAQVKLHSRNTGFSAQLSCLILPDLTNYVPSNVLDAAVLPIPKDITLADPEFNGRRKIELIIGTNLFWDILCVGQRRMQPNQPRLQKTQLGWILAGPFTPTSEAANATSKCHLVTNDTLHKDMEKFWEIEQAVKKPSIQPLDQRDACERHFQSTTTKDESGRFMINIPFKDNLRELGDSKNGAHRRFLSLERKLSKNNKLKEQYVNFMEEYESLGHMTEISNENLALSPPSYYLPHHAVLKEDSTTTKLRVVFDGSYKTSSGLSLNDVQHVGPPVQEDLFSIVTRFRQHNYVLSADVTKMYRQILVKEEQRRFQRILWRTDHTKPIKTYELNTVTYGTASAPFLATRCLRELGNEYETQHPSASRAILRDFYVDDLLTGTNTIAEARTLKQQLIKILKSAGMELRKWASNNAEIFETKDNNETHAIAVDKNAKTLGLWWQPTADKLKYMVTLDTDQPVTKRTILSTIAQIFDPLGLVGPATIQAKLLMQRMWQLNIHWDESLPQDIYTEWISFRQELNHLNYVIVPRQVLCRCPSRVELHGFCDASERAYGACIYLRSTNSNGEHTTRLLCAKSKVAPLKTVSLPRLELCGAQLLAQLYDRIKASLDITLQEEHFWCDSTITLAWINSSPSRWKTFVANRVTEIQDLTNNNWHHVPTETNPADIISRGITPGQLLDSGIWWNGPSWLSQDQSQWPLSAPTETHELPESRSTTITLTAAVDQNVINFKNYSSLNKLTRIVAYCNRFINNARTSVESRRHGTLTSKERDHALKIILRISQLQAFKDELRDLTAGKSVSNSSKLLQLKPFLDNSGLIRVGGRLEHAEVAFDQKHPIILPGNHSITKLIIENEHKRLLHAGCQAVMSSIRTRYWPLSCKNTIKGIIRKCIPCFRVRPIGTDYIMGNLPSSRVIPSRPFYSCGVDYAGPIYTKAKPRDRTTTKSYICVFICFTTKAVHLELATDLSTNAFLNCFKRFISRRGIPHDLYSDNGKNFIGAQTELNDLRDLLQTQSHNETISNYLANQSIHWHLIPPHAPHFGGLWEAAVKSAKYHLRRVIGETRLTFEEFYTILTQIEACLNSRPLSPISDDPNDLTPLTPGHFLIGESLTTIPNPDVCHLPTNRLNRYQLLQQVLQHFWKRWQVEYLHTLQQRNKWTSSKSSPFKVGTMVVIREDNLPPLRWHLGRLIELHPGADGVTRVVSIKIANGIIKRPVSKICALPIEEEKPGSSN